MAASGFVHEILDSHDKQFGHKTNTFLKDYYHHYPAQNLHTNLSNNAKHQLVQTHAYGIRDNTNGSNGSTSLSNSNVQANNGIHPRISNPSELIERFNKNSSETAIPARELLKTINICDCPNYIHNRKSVRLCTCKK